MADVNRGNRPLSPHLQIYRPQINTITSILNRLTGNALLVGAILVTWWLLAAAAGPEAFARTDRVLTSWIGDLVMVLSLWALWYHGLAGLRHIFWDLTARGLEVHMVKTLGWAVIGASVLLTILTVLVI